MHGTEDEAVNVNEAYNLKKWSKNVKLQLIKGAGHTFGTKQPWEGSDLPDHFIEVLDDTARFLRDH